jgi:hypothetical protein
MAIATRETPFRVLLIALPSFWINSAHLTAGLTKLEEQVSTSFIPSVCALPVAANCIRRDPRPEMGANEEMTTEMPKGNNSTMVVARLSY